MGSNYSGSEHPNVVEQILDRLDACVYVTDLETDEILYINGKMKQEFGLADDARGRQCWKLLQDGFTHRCEFCPKHRLDPERDEPVVWEEHSPVTGKYYRNTDRIITWVDGRKAHMQHSVDINDMKVAEATLQQRLAQQQLMSAIAHRFVGEWDFGGLAQQVLKEIGEFMGADAAYILEDLPVERALLCRARWSPNRNAMNRGAKLSYVNRSELYETIRRTKDGNAEYIFSIDAAEFFPGSTWGVVEQILVPLLVGGVFWGCLGIASRNRDNWDESASQLARLLGGVISVALERRETESKLFNAEQKLRTVMDSVALAIFWKDTESRFQGGNSAFFRMMGVEPEEAIGRTRLGFMSDASFAEDTEEEARLIRTGVPVNVERRILLSSGEERWVHLTKTLVKNEAGIPSTVVGILEDITERKRNELQMLQMSSVLEESPQFIAYINRKGQFSYINPGSFEVTGYEMHELMAGGIQMLYDEETNRHIQEEILPRLYEEGRLVFELPLIRKDGERRFLSLSGFLVGSGEYNCAAIAVDITERRQLERDLLREKEAAERANEAKTEFLSRMSHEIRTPMNAIVGMTDIARGSSDVSKMHKCLEKIDIASKHLLGIINDILDMAKIEAHRMDLAPHEFDLERMVMDAMAVVAFLSEEKQQSMMVRLDRHLPRTISTDEMRLKQVITNLLSNAVKFTDRGGEINLNVSLKSHVGTEAELLFEVTDNGIGMSEAQMERLFSAFEQADGSITRRYGGTGLGLAICKQLVELMGGEIQVESTPGAGSRFRFTILAEAQQDSRAASVEALDAHVLVIDDSPEIRDYFLYVLQGSSIRCDLAEDGYRALELVGELRRAGGQYDVIFVDWEMPGMNGVETARRIQEMVGEHTIIIMISAFQWDAIEPTAKAAGITRFLPKPLFPSALLEAIRGHGDGREDARRAADRGGEPVSFAGYRILLAEDVEVNREIAAAILEDTGLEIVFAETGRQAVDLFAESPDRFGLILMDIHMPDMDGHEAARAIRAMPLPRAAEVPIIAMTADAFREDVEKCRRSGMNSHIPKPIGRDDLIRILTEHLRGQPRHPAPPPAPAAEPAAPVGDLIHVEEGIARVLGNRKLYIKLLGGCRVGELTERLTAAVGSGDPVAAQRVAHEFKGVSANLSLTALCAVVTEMEQRIKDGEPVEGMLPRLAETAEQTARAIASLCGKE